MKRLSVFSSNTWAFMECETQSAFAKGGWYMPCRNELKDIYDMYCGFEQGTCRANTASDINTMEATDDAVANKAAIDALFIEKGGMKLTGTSSYMWSVTLNGDGNKAFVQKFPYNATNSAFNTEKMVRCVKKVTLE